MDNKINEMILELRNIFPKADKNGEIFLNKEQLQMFEKTLQKYEYEKYKDKKVIILKKRANGFMYIYK
jgi:hypothetical protein